MRFLKQSPFWREWIVDSHPPTSRLPFKNYFWFCWAFVGLTPSQLLVKILWSVHSLSAHKYVGQRFDYEIIDFPLRTLDFSMASWHVVLWKSKDNLILILFVVTVILQEWAFREKCWFLLKAALSFVDVQSLSRVQLFATPWPVARRSTVSLGPHY